MKAPAASSCFSDTPAPTAPCGLGGTSELPTVPAACRDQWKKGPMKEGPDGWLREGEAKIEKPFKNCYRQLLCPRASPVTSAILQEWNNSLIITWQIQVLIFGDKWISPLCYNIKWLQWLQCELSNGFESILLIIFNQPFNVCNTKHHKISVFMLMWQGWRRQLVLYDWIEASTQLWLTVIL